MYALMIPIISVMTEKEVRHYDDGLFSLRAGTHVKACLTSLKLMFLPYREYTLNTQALQGKLTNRALLYFLIQDLHVSFRRVRQALSCVPALKYAT
jgi:hypothetical protein